MLSLGLEPPTDGHCRTWAGIRIDEGRFDETELTGMKANLIIDVPGLMSRGNWTAGLFIDDHAPKAVTALIRSLAGHAGGSTHMLSILVGHFLGVQPAPIVSRTEGAARIVSVEVAPHLTRAERSRVAAFGGNWNFAGRSSEMCRLDWGG